MIYCHPHPIPKSFYMKMVLTLWEGDVSLSAPGPVPPTTGAHEKQGKQAPRTTSLFIEAAEEGREMQWRYADPQLNKLSKRYWKEDVVGNCEIIFSGASRHREVA